MAEKTTQLQIWAILMEKEGWLRRHGQEPPRAMEQKITFKELGSFPEIFLVPRFETIDNIFPVGNFYKSVIAMCFTFGVRVCTEITSMY